MALRPELTPSLARLVLAQVRLWTGKLTARSLSSGSFQHSLEEAWVFVRTCRSENPERVYAVQAGQMGKTVLDITGRDGSRVVLMMPAGRACCAKV